MRRVPMRCVRSIIGAGMQTSQSPSRGLKRGPYLVRSVGPRYVRLFTVTEVGLLASVGYRCLVPKGFGTGHEDGRSTERAPPFGQTLPLLLVPQTHCMQLSQTPSLESILRNLPYAKEHVALSSHYSSLAARHAGAPHARSQRSLPAKIPTLHPQSNTFPQLFM